MLPVQNGDLFPSNGDWVMSCLVNRLQTFTIEIAVLWLYASVRSYLFLSYLEKLKLDLFIFAYKQFHLQILLALRFALFTLEKSFRCIEAINHSVLEWSRAIYWNLVLVRYITVLTDLSQMSSTQS